MAGTGIAGLARRCKHTPTAARVIPWHGSLIQRFAPYLDVDAARLEE